MPLRSLVAENQAASQTTPRPVYGVSSHSSSVFSFVHARPSRLASAFFCTAKPPNPKPRFLPRWNMVHSLQECTDALYLELSWCKGQTKKIGGKLGKEMREMRSLVVVCVVSLLLCVPYSRQGSAEAGTGAEVLQLSDENFHSTVEGADLAVVVFHAPWSVVGVCLEVRGASYSLSSLLVQVPPLP